MRLLVKRLLMQILLKPKKTINQVTTKNFVFGVFEDSEIHTSTFFEYSLVFAIAKPRHFFQKFGVTPFCSKLNFE